MRKFILALIFVVTCLTPAFADLYSIQQQRQADSDYRVTVEAYHRYQNDKEALPDLCQRLSNSIYTNNHLTFASGPFETTKYKKQTKELKRIANEVGCPQ